MAVSINVKDNEQSKFKDTAQGIAVKVAIVEGGSGGGTSTEYVEGATTDPATGTAILIRNASDELVVPSALNPIPVDIQDASIVVDGESRIVGTIDGLATGTERVFVNNRLIQLLSSHDLVKTFTWLDFGTKTERVSVIAYASAALAMSATRTFGYTNISGKYRLDTDTWNIVGGP